MPRHLSDEHMAAYWSRRLRELERMRPMTHEEALALAERHEREAAACDARVAAAAEEERGVFAGEPHARPTLREGVQAIGYLRQSVWGESTRALLHRDQAEAYRRIAAEPVGTALAASIADARAKAEYYAGLVAGK